MSEAEGLSSLLIGALDRERLGHALFWACPDESDPAFHAQLKGFAQAALCMERAPGKNACGRCGSCAAFKGEELLHPDARFLRPEREGLGYGVEQIRDLAQFFSLRRALSPRRLCWLPSAELLSASGGGAANALLKLLEEPRPHSLLLLSSAKPQQLMATLRSRCQSFRFQPPPTTRSALRLPEGWEALAAWLEKGAPPRAARPDLPADSEAYWKEREQALHELEGLQPMLWEGLKPSWERFDLEAGRRVLDFFPRFEEFLRNIRNYGHGATQWLAFKSEIGLKL